MGELGMLGSTLAAEYGGAGLNQVSYGLIALLDPVVSKPTWTSLVFEHAGLGEAMKHLFEDRWLRAAEFLEQAVPVFQAFPIWRQPAAKMPRAFQYR